ncbi:MAG: hypothetical protein EXX96DRAFT_549376 [Benjaminiella poitrasii]|nr:MAG: hypothetical protein EXX96DRAFT_549376 [Benjaminiella poitrasii]
MSSFHILKKSKKSNTSSNIKSTNKNTKYSTLLDRPLPKVLPPGNFNINYETYKVKIPNYTFGRAIELADAGGLIAVSVGKRNKDNKVILAKISPHAVRLEREFYVTKRLYSLPNGHKYIPNAIEYVSLVQDGLAALLYEDIYPNDYIYFEHQHKRHYFTLLALSQITNDVEIWNNHTPISKCNEISLDNFLNFAIECCSALQFLHENGVVHGELRPSAFQCTYDRDQKLRTKVWNFGGGLNSYEELLLTTSIWRSFMSENYNNNTNPNTIPSPPPPPPPPPQSNQHQHPFPGYFQYDDSEKIHSSPYYHNAPSSRFYSPKEFQSSLIYVSPEQTGRTADALDHRADLYALGIMFFVILTDTVPFKGTAMDIIHAILSKNVPLVHTIRHDVPPVISLIIDKLTQKTAQERYDSAYGLREDLFECQRRLSDSNFDELVYFQLGLRDINPVFKVSDNIYGRSKESELISSVIENAYNLHQQEKKRVKILQEATLSNTNNNIKQDHAQVLKETTAPYKSNIILPTATETNNDFAHTLRRPPGVHIPSTLLHRRHDDDVEEEESNPVKEADNLLRINSAISIDHTACEVIVLKGPGGIGKSSLISTLSVQARHCGYTACAKFDKNQKRPYNGLLRCLSLILRQLLTESEQVIREFYKDLKNILGPQFGNVSLIVSMVPELKPILYDYHERINSPNNDDALSNILNTETRFHSVFLNIIRTIARKKLVTLCLDDLQEADESSIQLISALIHSHTVMLIILTFRDGDETPQKVINILDKCVMTNSVTTIQLRPLNKDAIKELVLNTFYNSNKHALAMHYHEKEKQQRIETIMPLVDIIYSWTRGNPFYVKQFLKTMKRKDDIWFDWNMKCWKFRLDNIKKIFNPKHENPQSKSSSSSSNSAIGQNDFFRFDMEYSKKLSAQQHEHYIFDIRNLVSHLRSLEPSVQCFLMWASLIGHVFNFRRIKWLMIASSSASGELSDDNCSIGSSHSANNNRPAPEYSSQNSLIQPSVAFDSAASSHLFSTFRELTSDEEERLSNQAMIGLQVALSEGVIQYKSGNEFQFIHDRYYQAASMLIVDRQQKETMHLKIGQMLMMEEEVEEDDTVFLTAYHLIKSVRLIRLMDKRKYYRSIFIKAGNEATLSGALQISATYYKCALSLLDEDIDKRWQDGPESSISETLSVYMKILEHNLVSSNHKDVHNESVLITTDALTEEWLNSSMVSDDTNPNQETSGAFLISDEERDSMIQQIMDHTQHLPLERAQAWRIRARICFEQSQYRKGIQNILEGLEELGIVVDTSITEEEVLEYYHAIKPSIAKPGFEILMKAGPCQNAKQMAVMTLLNEACTGAYWVNTILVDFFALKLCEHSLKYGYTAASGGGFIWVGCTATRTSEFYFAAQLGKFGMSISEKYAGNSEIARAIIVHHSMLAQWTGVHVREYIYQYQRAYKFAIAGGDQIFSSMALFHVACTLYWTSCNLSELHWHMNHSLEECRKKGSSKDVLIMNISLWRSILVFQGKTDITMNPETMMNDPDRNFDEPSFVEDIKSQSVNSGNPLNWHYSFKMILLFHFGFTQAASDLGFKIFDSTVNEAVHRHVGIAMYYHSMAIVESLRDSNIDPLNREKYEKQLKKNEARLNELAAHSEVNYRMYHKIVQAQISTLDNNNMSRTFELYNEVMELCLKGKWYSFLGLAYELASEYYMRCNLTMLAIPALCRSVEFYSRWGAFGKVQYLKKKYSKELNSQTITGKKDAAVQTEDVIVGLTTTVIEKNMSIWDNNSSDETTPDPSLKELYSNEDFAHQHNPMTSTNMDDLNDIITSSDEVGFHREDILFSLDMIDLTSIIKSSQVISNEMNSFDELLKKMIGIIMTNSGAESGAIIIKEGYFGIAAYSVRSSDTCETFEPPLPLRDDDDKISTSIVHYVIHTHANLFIANVEADTRFSTGDNGMKKGSIICMPIMHKNTLVGVLYLQANLNTFTHKHANVLAILCDQIGISITNALLFKSVQKATMANALMIERQLKALEEARASREQALHATKMKSNFLANMSHELRTPFSGFYGMICLLSETRLDIEQRELVWIAKQSCEMLLHIIDDLLDFSKLEAHKVKLLHGLFYIEDLIADRIELLVTLATNKNVELYYFIDEDVPSMVYGDGNRIGQILMNLIGNAIKFTHHGEVIVRCRLDKETALVEPENIVLKISVQDTGIGMSDDEIKGLFLPFSQVDGSTTRNFGGTGLGLSICLQLVKLMHGDVHVHSVVNEGSIFTFTIQVKNGKKIAESDASYDLRCNAIKELQEQLGQPRILIISEERTKLMIQSFIPWIQHLEQRNNVEEGIKIAIENSEKDIPFDCVIMNSPHPNTLLELINHIENTPSLHHTRILLLIASTVDNVRRHFTNNLVTARNDAKENPIPQSKHLHHQHVFHPLVTRLSKPIRTVKLLNALSKALSKSTTTTIKPSTAGSSLVLDDNILAVGSSITLATNSISSSDNNSNDVTTSPFEINHLDDVTIANQSQPEPAIIIAPPYSRKTHEAFSPEELAIFKGQKILIAEDNIIAQKLIVKQLKRLGFTVEKCNNGFECFDTWKARGPGYFVLAWIDHHMPGCDGLEATKKIREYERRMNYNPTLPIIALTADIQLTAQRNCLNAGMNDYVTKPLMQKDLAIILRKYCLGPTIL